MTCADLARGLVRVDEQWITYNTAHKEMSDPLDSLRVGRDLALYADVRGVEQRFERSICARP